MLYTEHPKTAEQYVRLVDQALVEVDELRACIEYDMESMGSDLSYLEPIEQTLKRMRAQMADGSYQFADEDLPFMEQVDRHRDQLPFGRLLATINQTHRKGLAVDLD